ncbi:ABC transporter permease [Klugiella xanthotipulae]|uniref:Oligopeptide transport system permease protein n=1 Tax=Klugiella xanthotipulae TaxID=244735 RepID=A0A543HXE8_9MICO|nr:ABC transporter permease [Klugiella xanthotipulae]TQM63044.1 oligopeptide transport system permease protein [Klugiella xanthotipulae]
MPNNDSRSPEHYVAPLDETPLLVIDKVDENAKPSNLWLDAWRSLRHSPIFWISSSMILFILFVGLFPFLFTNEPPNNKCDLDNSNGGPEAGHPFGFTKLGCDVFARVVYGAQPSLTVGITATLLVVIVGVILGALAGFYGGFFDTIISRVGDMFFAIPVVLGAIVLMQTLSGTRNALTVALILSIFAWPQVARITRGAVLSAKNSDYVTASIALGVTRFRVLMRHVLPNSLAPVIVVATVSLGTFIVAEATLSYLGVGLPSSVMSWGNDISQAQSSIRTAPQTLLYPAGALSLTVLSFLMLGDVVRDALDPKARAR